MSDQRIIKFRVWDNAMIYDNFLAIHADPNYVMQFTGLKDINGTEIYEGDICEFEYNGLYRPSIFLGIVTFDRGAYYISNAKGIACKADTITYIIGNIYENPELLGEKL